MLKPIEVTALDMTFPGDVSHLLPRWTEIPADFRAYPAKSPFVEYVEGWFYKGADPTRLKTKEGIDRQAAFRHCRAIMGSYQPKHEHKIAGVAYLLSLWFTLE